jgi:hypothetical protein
MCYLFSFAIIQCSTHIIRLFLFGMRPCLHLFSFLVQFCSLMRSCNCTLLSGWGRKNLKRKIVNTQKRILRLQSHLLRVFQRHRLDTSKISPYSNLTLAHILERRGAGTRQPVHGLLQARRADHLHVRLRRRRRRGDGGHQRLVPPRLCVVDTLVLPSIPPIRYKVIITS